MPRPLETMLSLDKATGKVSCPLAGLAAALDRAVRFNAFSANAVERILAAQARPKSVLEALADEERRPLPPLLDEPVPPRPLSEYQHLGEEPADHGQNQATDPDAERRPDTDEPSGPA